MYNNSIQPGDIIKFENRSLSKCFQKQHSSYRIMKRARNKITANDLVLYGPLNIKKGARKQRVSGRHLGNCVKIKSYIGYEFKVLSKDSGDKLTETFDLNIKQFDKMVSEIKGILSKAYPILHPLKISSVSMWIPQFYNSMNRIDCRNFLILDIKNLWDSFGKPESDTQGFLKGFLLNNEFRGKLVPTTWFDLQMALRAIARLGIKDIAIIIKRMGSDMHNRKWRAIYSNLRVIPELLYFDSNRICIPFELEKITWHGCENLSELEKLVR